MEAIAVHVVAPASRKQVARVNRLVVEEKQREGTREREERVKRNIVEGGGGAMPALYFGVG